MSRIVVSDPDQVGMRLDLFLAGQVLDPSTGLAPSRSMLQKMIARGEVLLNGKTAKPGARLKTGDVIEVRWMPSRPTGLTPEALPLDILYEDEDCIVLNKAPGMVVHPAAGRKEGTLVNALLYRFPDLEGIGGERRPGIVHRLDKDTSGVMVVAKNDRAFHRLASQFKEQRVRKEYLALVWGRLDKARGRIDRPIGRDRRDRKKMSSLRSLPGRRAAVTEWEAVDTFRVAPTTDRFGGWVTLLRVRPLSGRTHQIRVHLADQGHPVVGDKVYGRKPQEVIKSGVRHPELKDFARQALHAEKLAFEHPSTGRAMEFRAPLPADMRRLLESMGSGNDKADERRRAWG